MHLVFMFSFFMVLMVNLRCSSSSNQLNGQHLRVIWPRWSGNPKGLTGPLHGGVFLEYLSTRFNFTFEMIKVTTELEPTLGGGQIKYVVDNQCDLLIHNIIPTTRRNQIVDLTLPWFNNPTAILIPIADEAANIYAVAKPYQWPIWLGIGISIFCVIVVLNLIQLFLNHCAIQSKDERSDETNIGNNYLYVFGILLSQGGPCKSKRLPIRLVAGVWCLAAFIFVQAYSSLLFSYVVAPVNQPLINSFFDIFEQPNIKLFLRIGTVDLFIEDNKIKNPKGLTVKIEKALNSHPNSRCAMASECVKQITPGSRNVYIEALFYLKDILRADYKRTGKCNFQLARDEFMSILVMWALPKNSPYTKSISKGILELHQAGIIDKMDRLFYPMPPQCDGKPQNKKHQSTGNKLSRLSLKNLTGAFVVLLIGTSLSLLAFLCEMIIFNISRLRRVKKIEIQPEPKNIVVEELNDEESSKMIQEELPTYKSFVREPMDNAEKVEERVVNVPMENVETRQLFNEESTPIIVEVLPNKNGMKKSLFDIIEVEEIEIAAD